MAAKNASLFETLRNYPVYEAPYAGDASKLSLDQAHENLSYLVDQSEARIEILTDFLRKNRHSLELTNLFEGNIEDVEIDLTTLQTWFWKEFFADDLNAHFSTLQRIKSRAQEYIAYSLIKDISILLSRKWPRVCDWSRNVIDPVCV